jgi:hypothetical protein
VRWEPRDTSTEQWLEAMGFDENTENPDWRVRAKFDGCIHLYRNSQSRWDNPEEEEDADYYLHLCDFGGLDNLIQALLSLKLLGREHFNTRYEDAWMTPEDHENAAKEHEAFKRRLWERYPDTYRRTFGDPPHNGIILLS